MCQALVNLLRKYLLIILAMSTTHTGVFSVTQTKETLLTLTLLFMKNQEHGPALDPLNGSGLVNGKKTELEQRSTRPWMCLTGPHQGPQTTSGIYVPSGLQLWSLLE